MEINRKYIGCFGKLKKFAHDPTAIVIHHTATISPARTRETLKKKGYSTHFEVSPDGEIYQYAEIWEQCSHVGSANSHCIGVDVTHMTGKSFPAAQIAAVRWLCVYLCTLADIPQEVRRQLRGIYPHSALGCTSCPDGFPLEDLE